jgi:deoxyribodipyrimidine photolyase-related protein
MKTALILYPHQLFPLEVLPEVDTVILVEEPLYFGVDYKYPRKINKQKLILHRASMRRYAEEVLWASKIDVDYVDLDVFMASGDVLTRAKKFDKLLVFDPVDDILTKRLLAARRESGETTRLEFLSSPNFYLTDQEVRDYFANSHKQLFADFYQWQRERFNILIDENYKPAGGKWSFDEDNSKKLPKDQQLPSFGVFGDNKFVKDATDYVQEHFPNNPGTTDFIWPTNHQEATAWLDDFVANRLNKFGPYHEAIDGQAVWVYHSALSSSLNTGLLSPQQVVQTALKRAGESKESLASVEGFIRQILGWREFVRGEYVVKGDKMRTQNIFKHQRRLTAAWYSGNLDIPPFDDMVKKVSQHGYAHHVERLMIAGNLMLLSEIHPDDVYKWFSELFIDSYDWVTTPNIYGMSQFADGGSLVTKPYISGSNFILTMSHYERGYWSDIWDGLYWRFIEKNRDVIKHNPNLRPMVQRLERLDPDHRRVISYRAEDFLNKFTIQ